FALQEWVDGVAIVVVILINTVIGFVVELKAVRSMESLRRMEKITAKVRRQGILAEIPASQLVPGDVVIIEGGDMVIADVRLIRSSKLQADESMLTGESLPVGKQLDAVSASAILAERANMLFKGTAVTRGSSEAVVVATGMHTELGSISTLVADAEATATPLEKRLEKLAQKLLWVILVIIALIVTAGIARGKEVMLMVETAIALAVAAIPEGLPVVATMALARGMGRMARKNALLNRLGAVETLGGTSVICTDKTGTLTENRMTVTRVLLAAGEIEIEPGDLQKVSPFKKDGNLIEAKDDKILYEALEIGTLCNNASLTGGKKGEVEGVGDPVETALLVAAAKAGIRREDLNERFPETREEAFDSDVKIMGTFHKVDGEYRVAVKGAPEAVLDICSRVRTSEGEKTLDDEARQWWVRQNAAMADEGQRILALAGKTVDSDEVDPYEELVLTGLVAMLDPPRQDVKLAISLCHKAGIRVVMVTGDQAKTAASIAAAVGLVEDKEAYVVSSRDIKPTAQMSDEDRRRYLAALIFARVSPRQKLDLIDLHQKAGHIVAMTGDGVNDAPALKKADIGIAMGQRGTQVAREAADMVLEDDAFSTIVGAVEQGRVIFGNIRKFVLYLLSCNVSEVMIVFLASLVNAPMPI
ncbi:MAG: HAD-IC family P-type ATPase, partial [Arenicellales bacterium]|nr:HAD-IC family P-type ATPase [Arenicellales bacterium]